MESRLDTRVDDEAIGRDEEGVAAGQDVAAAKFVDEESPLGARAVTDIRQLDDTVHHGMLRWNSLALGGSKKEHRAAIQPCLGLQLLDELLELSGRCRAVLRRDQPVEHQDGCFVSCDLAPKQRDQT